MALLFSEKYPDLNQEFESLNTQEEYIKWLALIKNQNQNSIPFLIDMKKLEPEFKQAIQERIQTNASADHEIEAVVPIEEISSAILSDTVAESIAPTMGFGTNDPIVSNALSQVAEENNQTTPIADEITSLESQKIIEENIQANVLSNDTKEDDWIADFTQFNISDIEQMLSVDKEALKELKLAHNQEALLMGFSVTTFHVATDTKGEIKQHFGLRNWQCVQDLNEIKPRLIVSHSVRSAQALSPIAQTMLKNTAHQHNTLTQFFIGSPNWNAATQEVNSINLPESSKETLLGAFDRMSKQSQPTLEQQIHLMHAVKKAGDELSENDREVFFQAMDKNLPQNRIMVFALEEGIYLEEKRNFSYKHIPDKYKGKDIQKEQVLDLLAGKSVEIDGISDDKLNTPYRAKVMWNLLKGDITTFNSQEKGQEQIQANSQAVQNLNTALLQENRPSEHLHRGMKI